MLKPHLRVTNLVCKDVIGHLPTLSVNLSVGISFNQAKVKLKTLWKKKFHFPCLLVCKFITFTKLENIPTCVRILIKSSFPENLDFCYWKLSFIQGNPLSRYFDEQEQSNCSYLEGLT